MAYDRKKYRMAYNRSEHGYTTRAYARMKYRVASDKKYWAGLPVLPKADFFKWVDSDDSFKKLFKQWEENDYAQKYSPCVDRIDPKKGYILGNIQWITHSDNAKKARRTVGGNVHCQKTVRCQYLWD